MAVFGEAAYAAWLPFNDLEVVCKMMTASFDPFFYKKKLTIFVSTMSSFLSWVHLSSQLNFIEITVVIR